MVQQAHASSAPVHTTSRGEVELLIPCWCEDQQIIKHVPASALPGHVKDVRNPLLLNTDGSYEMDKVVFALSSDRLLTFLQYNVLRGCVLNRDFISPLQPQGQGGSSTALTRLPTYDTSNLFCNLLTSLRPTLLQRTITHAAWIDIFLTQHCATP